MLGLISMPGVYRYSIDKLDKLVDQHYLETQLAPIRGEVSLILKTLLKTSKQDRS